MSPRSFARTLGLLGLLLLLLWSCTLYVLWRLGTPPPLVVAPLFPSFEPSLPPPPEAPSRETVIGAGFTRRDPNPPELPGSWPHFRGPGYDGISRESQRLADSWPAAGPPELWSVDLCHGFSGAAIHRGRAYILDYDSRTTQEMLRCLSMSDGREIWRRWHDLKLFNNHGYVHTTPAISERTLAVIGAKNHLMCVDPESGDLRWGLDLVRAFGEHFVNHFSVQTPLIDGSTIVIASAGDSLLAGLDAETGKILWKTPNERRWKPSYSSVIPALIGGKRHYLYSADEGIVAVSAEEGSRGQLLWQVLAWPGSNTVPLPVVLDGGLIFLTTGYSRGSMLLGNAVRGGAPNILWQQDAREGFSSEAHTPLYADRHLFGVPPDSAGAIRGQLVCVNPHNGGKTIWASGKDRRFGMYQPYLLADGKIFILGADEYLTMVRATSERYEELGRARILKNGDWHSWMALAGGRLLIRENNRLACFDLR
ncbi:MAG TPA: PQQ-binding-like beta-propeller repeat protein [Planctomycetota bacterium]|jgi:outer membrane protein assembly factor BamB|nr:PQQ-binding-like beta-propeller repeat protein [Planctomycetota bacterium]